jgi:hypothetical protein
MRDIVPTAGAIVAAECSPAKFYRDVAKYGPPPRIRMGRGFVYEPDAVRAWAEALPR